jgi:nitroreductase
VVPSFVEPNNFPLSPIPYNIRTLPLTVNWCRHQAKITINVMTSVAALYKTRKRISHIYIEEEDMDVLKAIETRKSIRAFTDQEVSKGTIEKLLEISQRSPSGTNTQPWQVYVCTGAVRQAITDDVLALASEGKSKKYEDYDYYPSTWSELHNNRRRGVGWGLYGLLGIEKGDRVAMAKQGARNFKFFDAPVGLFITTDTYLSLGSWADAGMYIQTIMLAARGLGLHTCPQAAWITFQEPVFRHLGIPDAQALVSGMSLGYADESAIENTLVSEREDIVNVAHFRGF